MRQMCKKMTRLKQSKSPLFFSLTPSLRTTMTTSSPTQEHDTEHEVLTYSRVAGSINNLVGRDTGKMELKMDTPLTKALEALSSIPSVQSSVYIYGEENIVTIGGVDAGTLSHPKVDVILEKST